MTDRKSDELYIEGTDDDAALHDEILDGATEADEITALQSARWVVTEGLMTPEEAATAYDVAVEELEVSGDDDATSRFVETGEGLEIQEA